MSKNSEALCLCAVGCKRVSSPPNPLRSPLVASKSARVGGVVGDYSPMSWCMAYTTTLSFTALGVFLPAYAIRTTW